jgi:dienelactone hydrolase
MLKAERRIYIEEGVIMREDLNRISNLFLIISLLVFSFQASAGKPDKPPGDGGGGPKVAYSEDDVTGTTSGNHDLDCTIIRPYTDKTGPGNDEYPVVGWLNGWGQGDIFGAQTTEVYKPGLRELALSGPFVVVAANQWSGTESDVLQCINYLVDENSAAGSQYEGAIDTAKIGLMGHSQGGGGVIKAGDGQSGDGDLHISGVVAMAPYGPSWVSAQDQDGPVLMFAGTEDENTPLDSIVPILDELEMNDQGGALAVVIGGGHADDAVGDDLDGDGIVSFEEATSQNFGRFQTIVEKWFDFYLNDNSRVASGLRRSLSKSPFDTEYTSNFDDF